MNTISPERQDDLIKLVGQLELTGQTNQDAAFNQRVTCIKNTARVVLGLEVGMDITAMDEQTQRELLFVMRSLRESIF